jgi:2-polyprenyl-6-methoxyphenol hydroxylase-like FAD-dependent oxidoreductase
MKQVVIVGAGKIGVTIAALLLRSGSYRVQVVDQDAISCSPAPHSR